jgi:rubrerythrin
VATEFDNRTASTGASTEVVEGLNDLLQLDHDAIGAYQVAIEKLEDRDWADQIAGFMLDHERHVRHLNELVTEYGGTPVNEPHATGPFKTGLQRLGGLGGDKGLLIAFRANELQVRAKYDRYASRANRWPAEVKRVIDENALDEERHYAWVSSTLDALGVLPGEGLEVDVIDRLRERSGLLREQTGQAMESVRARAADGLESAAQRLDRMADGQAAAGGARARAAGAAHRVAGGMESTAGILRDGNVGELRVGVEDSVRTNPLRAVLITFAAGFVVGRILR